MWNLPFFAKKQPSIKPQLIIMDGDQPIPELFRAYRNYIIPLGVYETHFVRFNDSKPKILKHFPEIKCVYLTGFTSSKEVVDKYIFGLIQYSVDKGYSDIAVISSDYDFIDIFNMCNIINGNKNVKFTLIIPKPRGRLVQLNSNENIEVIKDR